jgi:tRNA pseudouridine38-40 synthase
LRNLRLVLEYDGTDFEGWQRQPAPARTVQQVVEDALARLTGGPATLRGAGRTDAGVHARAQVANVFTATPIPLEGLRRGLGAALPPDVSVVAVTEVPGGFDARRSARGKHYAYRLWNRDARSPLHARTSWHILRPLDRAAMAEAGRLLLGEHDFSAYRAASCDRKNPVRILRRCEIVSEDEHLLAIHLEATAFLRHMVRVIAGTLVEIGLGKRAAAEAGAILAGRDRTRAGRTAPARGLTLEEVRYDEDAAPGV